MFKDAPSTVKVVLIKKHEVLLVEKNEPLIMN
jgi:hypothetical protein